MAQSALQIARVSRRATLSLGLLLCALIVAACTYDYNNAPAANPTNPRPYLGAGVAIGL